MDEGPGQTYTVSPLADIGAPDRDTAERAHATGLAAPPDGAHEAAGQGDARPSHTPGRGRDAAAPSDSPGESAPPDTATPGGAVPRRFWDRDGRPYARTPTEAGVSSSPRLLETNVPLTVQTENPGCSF